MSEKKSTRPEEKPQPETFYAGRGSRQIGKREDPTEPPTPLLPPTPEEKFLKRQAPREPKPAPKNDDEQPASTLTRPRVGSSRVGSSVLIGAPDELLEAYEQAVLEAEAEEESQQSENERRKLSPLSTLEAVRDGLLFIFGKFLRLVRRLDMHGGGTGNNINFVEGLIDFLAGSLGGAAQVYVSQPLDTVKVKLQTFPEAYKGMFDCFVSTYRKDGIFRGLYAGSLPAVVANVAENSVLFAAYGGCQKFVAFMVNKETTSQLTTTQNACAGSLAACFSTLTLQALREMKHYIEPSHPQDMRTPWSLTRYIWRTEAIKQFLSIIQNSLPMFLGACNISPSASTPTNPQSNQNQNDVDVDAGSTPRPQHPDSDGFSSSHHRTPPSPPPISPGGAGAGPARATPAAQPLASQSNVQRRGEQHHAAEQIDLMYSKYESMASNLKYNSQELDSPAEYRQNSNSNAASAAAAAAVAASAANDLSDLQGLDMSSRSNASSNYHHNIQLPSSRYHHHIYDILSDREQSQQAQAQAQAQAQQAKGASVVHQQEHGHGSQLAMQQHQSAAAMHNMLSEQLGEQEHDQTTSVDLSRTANYVVSSPPQLPYNHPHYDMLRMASLDLTPNTANMAVGNNRSFLSSQMQHQSRDSLEHHRLLSTVEQHRILAASNAADQHRLLVDPTAHLLMEQNNRLLGTADQSRLLGESAAAVAQNRHMARSFGAYHQVASSNYHPGVRPPPVLPSANHHASNPSNYHPFPAYY
ncbi:GL14875 [Drosophila persimilis]|uniref:GL14875 n=1 Tax=Drosophila persimilis TaxID=7234 RepID=B4H0E3_DROPE|nr:GL14875 [Drosophila persimilis]